MVKPCTNLDEVAEYISGDLIQCLECERWYKQLTGKHLRSHGLTPNEYRDKWGLPRGTPLMGQKSRKIRSNIMREMMDCGKMTHWHLPDACERARRVSRGKYVQAVKEAQSSLAATVRPGDWSRLPPGSRRANGKNADREREYQRAYRALKKGDPEPMRQYKIKWRK